MKNLREAFGEKHFVKDSTEEWYQLMGKELTAWFKTNCYWLAWKYDRDSLERAFDIAKKERDHELAHFINNVKRG